MSTLQRAEQFIWENARLLERQRFAYHFKQGSAANVINALRAFQNADGGFGNALEPDIRCPDSQPVPTQHALEFLDEVGFEQASALVQQCCDYLLTITTAAGGVPWLLPSALAYPRAPWWQTDLTPKASLNPTAAIAGVLHKNRVQHRWLDAASQFCWRQIEGLTPTEMHEAGVVLIFLRHVPDRTRAERQLERLVAGIFEAGLIANLDADGYVRKALDWAPTPDHLLRPYFDDQSIAANLDVILAAQAEDGGWKVPWPSLSAGCEAEWRGWITLEKLRILRTNGRC